MYTGKSLTSIKKIALENQPELADINEHPLLRCVILHRRCGNLRNLLMS
jgi:hypothetical protein